MSIFGSKREISEFQFFSLSRLQKFKPFFLILHFFQIFSVLEPFWSHLFNIFAMQLFIDSIHRLHRQISETNILDSLGSFSIDQNCSLIFSQIFPIIYVHVSIGWRCSCKTRLMTRLGTRLGTRPLTMYEFFAYFGTKSRNLTRKISIYFRVFSYCKFHD